MSPPALPLLCCALALSLPAAAAPGDEAPAPRPTARSKLLLTAGVSSIDGTAGGGLTPWAVTGTQATEHEVGATAFVTRAVTSDYALTVKGATVGIHDRVELSLARQDFDAGVVVPGTTLKLDIAGIKLKVAGDAILDADTWQPQVAVGLFYKHLDPGSAVGGVLDSVGARRHGVEVYASATKLLLAHGVLLNGTLRATQANQNGLLGFGTTGDRRLRLQPELSIAKLLRKDLAIGAEYRFKPDRLAFAGPAFRESDWKDVFVAWAPNKHLSVTLAWVDLGQIVGHDRQRGAYLSIQAGL